MHDVERMASRRVRVLILACPRSVSIHPIHQQQRVVMKKHVTTNHRHMTMTHQRRNHVTLLTSFRRQEYCSLFSDHIISSPLEIQCPHDSTCPKKELNVPCRIATRYRPLQIFDLQSVSMATTLILRCHPFDLTFSTRQVTQLFRCPTLFSKKPNEIPTVGRNILTRLRFLTMRLST